MFDKLDDLLLRFEEVLNELGEPQVTANQERFQKLMKEQSDLQPIVEAYSCLLYTSIKEPFPWDFWPFLENTVRITVQAWQESV